MQGCLAWVGQQYEGQDEAEFCSSVLRSVLLLPLDRPVLSRFDFNSDAYAIAHDAYGEILSLTRDENNWCEADLLLAEELRERLEVLVHDVDYADEEWLDAHVTAMVEGVQQWLPQTPGGLAEAVRDLAILMKGHLIAPQS